MIKRVPGGYQVFSDRGRPLSKPGLTYKQAEERLAQVEYWKDLRSKEPKEKKDEKKAD